jgi:hypothetical protein
MNKELGVGEDGGVDRVAKRGRRRTAIVGGAIAGTTSVARAGVGRAGIGRAGVGIRSLPPVRSSGVGIPALPSVSGAS